MSSHHLSSHHAASHYLSSHYGRLALVPEVIHPMGADPHWRALRARILREDDEILAIVAAFMAFMEIKD